MSTVILVLLIANLIALVALGLRHQRLRTELAELRTRAEALSAGAAPLPEDLRRMAREGASMLSIRILNPMELAAQKHWIAGIAGRITPGLVRRIVSNEAAKIVRQELPKYGVIAEVEVVGARAD
jgi:hypothetical protein